MAGIVLAEVADAHLASRHRPRRPEDDRDGVSRAGLQGGARGRRSTRRTSASSSGCRSSPSSRNPANGGAERAFGRGAGATPWSGDRTVAAVDVSHDFGATWMRAELDAPVDDGAWQDFRANVRAAGGRVLRDLGAGDGQRGSDAAPTPSTGTRRATSTTRCTASPSGYRDARPQGSRGGDRSRKGAAGDDAPAASLVPNHRRERSPLARRDVRVRRAPDPPRKRQDSGSPG